MNPELSILIPVRNEEENVKITKAKYTEAIEKPACVLGIHLCECCKSCHL